MKPSLIARQRQNKKSKTIKTALNQLDAILSKGDRTARDLWHILSALRGPDFKNELNTKHATTALIRSAAFPKTAKQSDLGKIGMPIDFKLFSLRTITENSFSNDTRNTHFSSHVIDARDVLLEINRNPYKNRVNKGIV